MLNKIDLNKSIYQSIEYLTSEQHTDGSFPSVSSPTDFKKCKPTHVILTSTLIFLCLNSIDRFNAVDIIKKKLFKFLINEKSDCWSFSYWPRKSKKSKLLSYPDNLDVTFCTLSTITQYCPNLLDGESLAKITMMLSRAEEKEGGPYKTWAASHKDFSRQDVDIAVNCKIAYFLSLQGVELPHLTKFFKAAIRNIDLTSKYYHDIYITIYFLSRFYKGPYYKNLESIILSTKKPDGSWGNPLATALAISSLINLGLQKDNLKKSIDYLLNNQIDGSWKAYPFFINPGKKEIKNYIGSANLTTAFCLEAIHKYKDLDQIIPDTHTSKENLEKKIYLRISKEIDRRISPFDSDFKNNLLTTMNFLLSTPSGSQIPLLSHYFWLCFTRNNQKKIPVELLVKAGSANIFTWVAYTIFDDFFDEASDIKMLPIAIMCLRELTTIYNSILSENAAFKAYFHTVMDRLESANSWELANCRLPIKNNVVSLKNLIIPDYKDYKILADRSFAHGLGPTAILFFLGYKTSSPSFSYFETFFCHYLIARQLNDDAHDLEEDIKKGQISAIVAALLKRYLKNKKDTESIPVSKLISELQPLFWYEMLNDVCSLIKKHVDLSVEALYKIKCIDNYYPLEGLLDPIKFSVKKAQTEQLKALSFIKTFHT